MPGFFFLIHHVYDFQWTSPQRQKIQLSTGTNQRGEQAGTKTARQTERETPVICGMSKNLVMVKGGGRGEEREPPPHPKNRSIFLLLIIAPTTCGLRVDAMLCSCLNSWIRIRTAALRHAAISVKQISCGAKIADETTDNSTFL